MSDAVTVTVPDIGNFAGVEVIEILVKPGDSVKKEDALITLESDKASMEIPSPYSGTVTRLAVNLGDKVSQGTPIVVIEQSPGEPAAPLPKPEKPAAAGGLPSAPAPAETPPAAPAVLQTAATVRGSDSAKAHASPSVRRFARELGIDLGLVSATGPKGRILREDVQSFAKSVLSGTRVSGATGAFVMPQIPPVDFSKFGPIEIRPLNKIKRLAGQNLHRSWINVPLVTQFDEADITELEAFRKSKLDGAGNRNLKLTLVTFIVKACVVALKRFPQFNASLSADGESLILKQYYHIGVAVNTDNGLMVPVVRDVNQKGLVDLAVEIQTLSAQARAGKLPPPATQGGCFTISSLGGIGGTGFTPIVNAPEVAILGVSKSRMTPVYVEDELVPRLILPFCLSYDHRVIDGVAAVMFTRFLSAVLSDIREILL